MSDNLAIDSHRAFPRSQHDCSGKVLWTLRGRHSAASAAVWNSRGVKSPSPSARDQHRQYVSNHDLCSPLQLCCDALLILSLSVVTGVAYHLAVFGHYGVIRDFLVAGAVTATCFVAAAQIVSGRHPAALTDRYSRFRHGVIAWCIAVAMVGLMMFLLRVGGGLSRGAGFLLFTAGIPVVGIWRATVPPVLSRVAQKIGYASRDCIIIGSEASAVMPKFVEHLIASGLENPSVIVFRAGLTQAAWQDEHQRMLAEALNVAHRQRRGEIYLCADGIDPVRLAGIQRSLSVVPRAIYVVPDSLTASLVQSRVSAIGDYLALEVCQEPLNLMQRAIKRSIDFVAAALAIVLFSPLLLLLALAVKLDSPGPVIFRQTRNGYRGRPFKIWKLRTMRVQEDGQTVRQASRNDPRVTRVGRLLRQTSLDELPQLFNVLMGSMSLVGPRPHAIAHDEFYAKAIENYVIRQHVKPGITGWAQVNGLRGETATLDLMYRRIEHDLWYAVHASILLDIEILVRTAYEVVRRRNAY